MQQIKQAQNIIDFEQPVAMNISEQKVCCCSAEEPHNEYSKFKIVRAENIKDSLSEDFFADLAQEEEFALTNPIFENLPSGKLSVEQFKAYDFLKQ